MTIYNKLVRDRIPEIIEKKGQKAKIHIAGDGEYAIKLKEKLIEEINEFYQNENEEEFADILEVIDALRIYKKFENRKVLSIKKKKFKERGGFSKKIILEES